MYGQREGNEGVDDWKMFEQCEEGNEEEKGREKENKRMKKKKQQKRKRRRNENGERTICKKKKA